MTITGKLDQDVSPIFNAIMAPYHTSTVLLFNKLGLFDYIKHNGTVSVQELASHAKWSIRATSAMLISLASSRLLVASKDSTKSPSGPVHSFEQRYALEEKTSRFLCTDEPGNICGYLELFWEISPQQLLEKASSNKKKENFMLESGGNGAPSETFINAMQGQTAYAAMVLAPLLTDLSDAKHFVDVAGGSGTFCIEVCKAFPSLKGSVYELPGVCPIVEKYTAKSNITDRVATIPGNMFEDRSFPSADVYAFGNVLHDWSDKDNKILLTKAFQALPSSGGKVVLLEMLVSEDITSTSPAAAGLNVVMVTNEDGRQYKLSELEAMLLDVGFVDVTVISSPLTPYSAVVAMKK